ncbi:MAG: VWA domain-containing protein [Saprospiraceae bacterium]|nr:VWA domain-containing protein [Saprospiraceae bacterium]
MFRLEESWAFYLLLLIPLIVLISFWTNKKLKNAIIAFSEPQLFKRLLINKSTNQLKFYLLLGSMLFLILALVNPQFGLKKEKMKVERSDIIFALDISNSMNATDVSPTRLEKAKRFITQLINERKGDQIGLILFAGSAYLQMPLTTDYAAAVMFTKSANTEMAGTQGTAISEAIQLAMKSVKDVNQRALIILSDGEDHDDEANSNIDEATSKGWTIFTIGIGTDQGGFVPVIAQGREEFKTDEKGDPVRSVVNKSLLKSLADKGNGQFYMLTESESTIISDINMQLEKMQKRAIEIKSFSEYRSFYQYFLFIALVLLIFSFFYSFTQKAST